MERIFIWSDRLRTGLWPIPLALALFAVLLHELATLLDALGLSEQALRHFRLYSGSGDDARNLLSTLVAAIITMSSVVFSITIVALSLGANQFGSRLVRTYMADIRTKLALGLFTMTIVYCLLTLRSVEQDMPPGDVPHVAVTLGLVLALICVLALLFFLHFVGRSIVADEVIRRVASELEQNIAELPALDTAHGPAPANDGLPEDFLARCAVVRSHQEGYVQVIEYEHLLTLACEHDLRLRLDFRAGTFICEEGTLALVYPGQALTQAIYTEIQNGIVIGHERTPTQDIEFTIRHLVDIALRALSPGINDANTSLVVIDHLSGALARLMKKSLPTAICRDEAGTVRVLGKQNDHPGILGACLNQIRQAAASQPAVIIELLRAVSRIGEHVRLGAQRDALVHHAQLIAAAGLRELEERCDREDIENAFAITRDRLQQKLLQR